MIVRLWQDTISSTLFLSRLPVAGLLKVDRRNQMPIFGDTAHTFALAGAVIGLLPAFLLFVGLWMGLNPLALAWLTVGVFTLTTGALHEDGLADVADGFWGGHDIARKLAIMRDSSIGSYGVLALLLTMGLKVALIAAVLPHLTPVTAACVVVIASALTRTAMLYPWYCLPNARDAVDEQVDDGGKVRAGLSARFGEPDFHTYLRGALWCLPFLVLLWVLCGITALVLTLAFVKGMTVLATRLAQHHIGGHTGDVLGATQQMAELAFWFGLAIALTGILG